MRPSPVPWPGLQPADQLGLAAPRKNLVIDHGKVDIFKIGPWNISAKVINMRFSYMGRIGRC